MKTNKPAISLPNILQGWWLVSIVAVLLVGGGSAWFVYSQSADDKPEISDKIDYSPPTAEEQKAGDEQKQVNVDAENNKPASTATVFISDASQYGDTVEVRASVTNVAEDGGTCTATFTQGSSSFSISHAAFMDASSTQCGALNAAVSKFSDKGKWSVVVHYASDKVSGDSAASILTIQ